MSVLHTVFDQILDQVCGKTKGVIKVGNRINIGTG